MPSAAEARALFRAFLREGAKFPNYNVREYVKRRAKQGFVEGRNASSEQVAAMWEGAKQQMETVKRQAVVYGMYARKHKNVMELRAPTHAS